MPAPTKEQIKTNIKTQLIGKGFYYRKVDEENNLIENKNELMPGLEDMVDAISEGVQQTWTEWQASQGVSAAVQVNTATGTGSTIPAPGNLP